MNESEKMETKEKKKNDKSPKKIICAKINKERCRSPSFATFVMNRDSLSSDLICSTGNISNLQKGEQKSGDFLVTDCAERKICIIKSFDNDQ